MEDCMTDQSHAFRKGVELGPLKPTCTDSDRAKLTADRLEGVVRMPMQALDMKQASVSPIAPIAFSGDLCRLSGQTSQLLRRLACWRQSEPEATM